MREPFLPARPKPKGEGGSETPQAFRKIPNRSAAVETLTDKSGGAGRKWVEGGKGPEGVASRPYGVKIPAPPSLPSWSPLRGEK